MTPEPEPDVPEPEAEPDVPEPDVPEGRPDEPLDAVLGRALGLGGAPAPGEPPRSSTAGAARATVASGAPRVRRPAPRRRRSRRGVVGLLVCAALAGALGIVTVVDRGGDAAVAPTRSNAAPRTAPVTTADVAAVSAGALADRLPRDVVARCRPASALDPDAVEALVCSPGPPVVRLEYFRYEDPALVAARFGSAAADLPRPEGDARCRDGSDEHRTWSRPDTPDVVAGEYACRRTPDASTIVWTVGTDLVARAEADVADGQALYAWWRSSSSAL